MSDLPAPPYRRAAVVLFAHGSRDAGWRAPIEAVAHQIRMLQPDVEVRCAYLEWTEPDLPRVVTELAISGARDIVVLPLFLGVGKHAREDLPLMIDRLRVQHPAVTLHLRPSVGEDHRLIETIARIALD